MDLPKIQNVLSDSQAQEIEKYARSKLTEINKLNDVIGSQIFQILGRYSRVLYYPLEDEDIWGFVEKTPKGCFVCINTSIAYDKQIFVAAHELFHIWTSGCDQELILAKNLDEITLCQNTISVDELKANRFAAAFLVNEGLLQQEMWTSRIPMDQIDIKSILKLANLFVVPYKTMVRRLFELQILDRAKFDLYMRKTSNELEILNTRMGLIYPNQNKAIVLDNLVETAMLLYDKNRITVEKLEQILRYSKLTLKDVGVQLDTVSPLTENELLDLLED